MSFWSKTTSLRWFFEVKWSSQQHYTYMYKAFLLWHASPGMDMDKVVAWRISLNPIPKWNCFFTITNWLGNELDLFVHFILFISASLPPCEANGANMGYKCSYLALKSRYLVSFFFFQDISIPATVSLDILQLSSHFFPIQFPHRRKPQ